MPEEPQERWLWMNRVGGACPIFRALTLEKEVAPDGFDMKKAFLLENQDPDTYPNRIPPALQAPFLQSFVDAPRKGVNLVRFKVCTTTDQTTMDALRALLATPGILPKVRTLIVSSSLERFLDADLLHGLARSLPLLQALHLEERYLTERRRTENHITVQEFRAFGSLLQRPLLSLALLNLLWMTDAHVGAIIGQHGRSLRQLGLGLLQGQGSWQRNDALLGDATLAALQESGCPHLRHLALYKTKISSERFVSFLESIRGQLREQVVSDCRQLRPEVMDVIIRHQPSLQVLNAGRNQWFGNDAIISLAQGFGSARLKELGVKRTRVTPDGLRSVLEMAPSSLECLDVGRTREQLMDGALNVSADPRLQGTREDWNALARDFPAVVFK